MRDSGVTCMTMKKLGYTLDDLVIRGGYTLLEFMSGGYTAEELLSYNFPGI